MDHDDAAGALTGFRRALSRRDRTAADHAGRRLGADMEGSPFRDEAVDVAERLSRGRIGLADAEMRAALIERRMTLSEQAASLPRPAAPTSSKGPPAPDAAIAGRDGPSR